MDEHRVFAPPAPHLSLKPSGLSPTFVNTSVVDILLLCAACVNRQMLDVLEEMLDVIFRSSRAHM